MLAVLDKTARRNRHSFLAGTARVTVVRFSRAVAGIGLELSDGRRLHVYDTSADDSHGCLVVFWHHGTPNIGAPPEASLPAAAELGIRWVSYDRPG
jgi:hypothetical protein